MNCNNSPPPVLTSPPEEAMELMQHSDARLTMSIYADASLAVTVDERVKSELQSMEMGLKSLSVTVGHAPPKSGEWSERQDSKLRHVSACLRE